MIGVILNTFRQRYSNQLNVFGITLGNIGARTECRKTKYRGQNVADKMSRTYRCGQNVARTKRCKKNVAWTNGCEDKMLHGHNVARTKRREKNVVA